MKYRNSLIIIFVFDTFRINVQIGIRDLNFLFFKLTWKH